jgi:MFS family permease
VSRLLETVVPARLGRPFRWLLASAWVTNLGDGIALAAGPLLIASQTHDPLIVALAPLLQQLPWLLFGLYAGALADRLDRRLMILVGDGLRACLVVVLVLAITTGTLSVPLLLALLFLLGVAETFVDTTAGTLTPMLVAKTDLGVATSRLFAGFVTVNQLVGPPVGAALFAAGMAWPFAAQFVLMLFGLVLVSRVRLPPHGTPRGQRGHLRTDIVAGLRWLWHHPPVRTLALTIVSFNVTWGAAWSVLVLYSTVHLGMSEVGFGLLTTATAVGGVVGTLSYDWLEKRVELGTLMRTCLGLEVLTHFALALAPTAWVAMLIMFVFGAYAFVWGTLSATVRQRAVPTAFQGRVNSAYNVGVFGGMVLGSGLGGLIARHFGVTAPFWFAGVGSAVILAIIWRQLPRIAHADEPVAEPA